MSTTSEKDENARIRRMMALDRNMLPPDGGPEFNRLIFATSPYLLQHADNPVDWYPWGEEAFARARSEDKPVFLSIGYATCHWCHVMEHESFEDEEVAAAFNASFVCIKVDREERPDIDEQYMAVAQMMSGSGGWPLNVFMTPDKSPFFAITYIPREPRMGLPGIVALLERVAELLRTERSRLEENGTTTLEALARLYKPHPGELPEAGLADRAFQQLTEMYDGFWGGFGSSPKFPMPFYLFFLLRQWKRTGDKAAFAMVDQTLRMLRQGGIYDQLGFGFHRYAVDREWLVPHFEKMLYDQALLALIYLEAFQASGDPFFRRVAEEILTYVLRDMTAPEGGFYAAQDADTEGEEGRCYLWAPEEIAATLGDGDAELFCRLFDVTPGGNFEGRNILHLLVPPETFASREGLSPEALATDLERWRQALLREREKRVQPFRDEKILTSWNGLMIAALARGYAVTGEVRYLEGAARAAGFIARSLVTPKGRLLRSFHRGEGAIPAFLDDYACFIWGLIELHQVTLEKAFLDGARSLAGEILRLFAGEGGGYYETGADAEHLPVRQQSAFDGAFPSGNGVAALALSRLGRIAAEERFTAAGEGVVRAFMGDAPGQPLSFLSLIGTADFLRGPEVTVTLTGEKDTLAEMIGAAHRRFLPALVLRYAGAGAEGEFPAVGGRATAYVCARGACRPPVTTADELARLLDELV
ncbi:MAG TPA: thioredoxin domain-containing protein [Geobacteraceae bacterium]